MRQWEAASWQAGRSQSEVIAQAGRAVAQTALRLTKPGDEILILAGRGHNGDDARAAQPHLSNREVRLVDVTQPSVPDLGRPRLIIDGLFGIGLNRPLDASWSGLIEQINAAGLPILAIDVPSGLNADTGEPQNIALRARVTVTLGAPKTGLLRPSSYPFTGRLELASDIGLIPCPFDSDLKWTQPEDFADFPPARRIDGHKGTFGHVAIVAGSEGYHGAAVLSARAALRASPGLVSVFCAQEAYLPVASQLQAAMVHPFQGEAPLPGTTTALVIGPGLASRKLGPAWKEFANQHWKTSPHPVIVDASALEWIEPGPIPPNSTRLITPHPGEAARLLGTQSSAILDHRVESLRKLSQRYGDSWVVLKGHQTLIGRGSGDVFVNSSGNPWLAQGGSGDVLAGFLGGLLAQRSLQNDPLKTTRYAIWAHGAAADRLTARRTPWTIDDLLGEIGFT